MDEQKLVWFWSKVLDMEISHHIDTHDAEIYLLEALERDES